MANRQAVMRARRALDERLASLPALPAAPPSGWIRAIRTALGMTQKELADRMGVTAQSAFQLEASERDHKVRLDTLRKAADALNCDLAYVLVPREGTLENTVRAQAAAVLDSRRSSVDRTMALEDQRAPLSDAARESLIELVMTEYPIWRNG